MIPALPGLPPRAGMLPAAELAAVRSHLAAVRAHASPALVARYDLLDSACARTDVAAHFPDVLLHDDCHPGNAVQTAFRARVGSSA